MEIRGSNGGVGGVHPQSNTTEESQKRHGVRESNYARAEGHTKSKELVRLADNLEQLPEIRDSEVERVSKILADGGYDTREAVLKTADALLRSS